jgi:putative DNA primase/helicase
MGARLVRMSEPSEGERWHEGKLKELTGESIISARLMHGNYFEFPLQCKFLILGNNIPSFAQVDRAIERRFVLIPFKVEIPEHERDVAFAEKLKPEWPGILSWMIEGARCWREAGLQVPDVISSASHAWLHEQSNVEAWRDERCEIDPNCSEKTINLFVSWKFWAKQHGEYPGSSKMLISRLKKLGFQSYHGRQGNGLIGIRVKSLT